MATLSEVARLAGVTTATVSNVLRNPGKVKASTVKKVKEAIAATGYRPNLMARALAEGRSSMIAMVLPSITNPFYPEFVRVAERVARQRDFFLMVCNTDEKAEIGHAYLQQIAGTLADGVLILHTGMGMSEIQELRGRRSPIVLASEENGMANGSDMPQVVVDFELAGQIAAKHLVELGHRHFGMIIGRGCGGYHSERLKGFKDVLTAAGIGFADEDIAYVEDTVVGGHDATIELVSRRSELTAIFCTNDLLAFGAMQALADRKIRVPQDISVSGVTDIQLAQDIRPALTTVSLRIDEIAKLSIGLLLDLVENPDHQPTVVRVPPPQLIVRDSTGPCRPD